MAGAFENFLRPDQPETAGSAFEPVTPQQQLQNYRQMEGRDDSWRGAEGSPWKTPEPGWLAKLMSHPSTQGLLNAANFIGPGPKATFKAYHGTNKPFTKAEIGANSSGASGSREGPLGFWMTDNPETAGVFADWAAKGRDGQQIMPLTAEFKNPLNVENYAAIKDIIDAHTKFKRPGYEIRGRNIRMTDDAVDYNAARQSLMDKGHDGIVLRKTMTDSPDGVTPIDQYVAIAPGTVRNRLTGEIVYSVAPALAAGASGAFTRSPPPEIE